MKGFTISGRGRPFLDDIVAIVASVTEDPGRGSWVPRKKERGLRDTGACDGGTLATGGYPVSMMLPHF